VTEPEFQDDRLFAAGSRDGSLEPYRLLRNRLTNAGRRAHTADVYEHGGEIPDLVLCLNAPVEPLAAVLPNGWRHVPRWALLLEPEIISPQNWRAEVQRQFSRLFTWRDSCVDGERFVKLNLPNAIQPPHGEHSAPSRFCTLIAGNKFSSHPLELYSARREAIRWFERHHPEKFDFYGIGWDLLVLRGPRPVRAFNVLLPPTVRRALAPQFLCYRGPVDRKVEVLRQYRFTICFENAREIDGYISEKIFDCLVAGTIPVYWGAPNIRDHVPAECFIDFRDLSSYGELYAHLASLSDEACAEFRRAGREFLVSDRAKPFSIEGWLQTLLHHL
jgi:hypothetical protein